MEVLPSTTYYSFEQSKNPVGESQGGNIVVRCLRKKFICLMTLFITIIVFCDIVKNIINNESITSTIKQLYNKTINKTTNAPLRNNTL